VHDVVQAELLGAMLELAGAASTAARGGDRAPRAQLASWPWPSRQIVAAVRHVLHGVYPAVLDTVGLSGSLEALRDEAPYRSGWTSPSTGCRTGRPSERRTCSWRTPSTPPARRATDDGERPAQAGGLLDVVLEGYPRAELPVYLSDRVGARGGRAQVRDARLEAVLPCG
jgi:hypothetical protein